MDTGLCRNRDFIPDFDGIAAETAARSRELAARATAKVEAPYIGRGLKVSRRLDAEMVALNRSLVSGAAPFGAMKHSGLGRQSYAVLELTEPQYVPLAL